MGSDPSVEVAERGIQLLDWLSVERFESFLSFFTSFSQIITQTQVTIFLKIENSHRIVAKYLSSQLKSGLF